MIPMATPEKSVNPLLVYFPADLIDEVDALCKANYMDRSAFIKLAIKQMLELYENADVPQYVSAADEEEDVLEAAEDDDN